MATLTFESFGSPPRRRTRAAARPAIQVVPALATLAPPPRPKGLWPRTTTLALVAGIACLHLGAVQVLSGTTQPLPAPPKAVVLALALSPPVAKPVPPPPPPPKATPLPSRARAAAAPVPAAAPRAAAAARSVAPGAAENLPPATPASESVAASAVQAAAAPVPVPASAPEEPPTEPRGYAGYLNNPAPDYPAAAQKRGLEGQVLLKVHVLASGQPDNVTVARSSGHAILDQAAIKAVAQWTFAPARRGQAPTDGWVQVPLTFKI